MLIEDLNVWLEDAQPTTFPYDAVVAEYRSRGKHFVSEDTLDALMTARATLLNRADPEVSTTVLRRFLQIALDKRDGRYDYASYIALSLLPIPTLEESEEGIAPILQRRDRLVVQLIADILHREMDAAGDDTGPLVQLGPDTRTVDKRSRLAARVAIPALERLGLARDVTLLDHPQRFARQLYEAVEPTLTSHDRLILQLSVLPVYVLHDEYLFIRVLQLFETTFALLAVQLLAAVRALDSRRAALAVSHLLVAESTLRESSPLFSLLATMQVDAFRSFRDFTHGASAIQSNNYKVLEALCRKPDPDRLDSAAFTATPDVRDRILAGGPTLDDAFHAASKRGDLEPVGRLQLEAAMRSFSATLQRWRQTHYRLAVRMLGERTGTGYTEGTAYLRSARDIDVFRSIESTRRDAHREAV